MSAVRESQHSFWRVPSLVVASRALIVLCTLQKRCPRVGRLQGKVMESLSTFNAPVQTRVTWWNSLEADCGGRRFSLVKCHRVRAMAMVRSDNILVFLPFDFETQIGPKMQRGRGLERNSLAIVSIKPDTYNDRFQNPPISTIPI